MSEKIKIETIPLEAITELKFSGAFYGNLQLLYFNYCELINDSEDFDIKKMLNAQKNKDPNGLNEKEISHIHTLDILLILLNELDLSFSNQVTINEVDKIPNED
jgi:hypothetical protein